METLNLLSVALGLAVLSGLNLYLTVFATGLAIRLHWVTLGGDFQQLAFLGDNWILGLAGTMFLIEFIADKIPWVDSVWDALHTIIRPLGGALLATHALGEVSPSLLVTVGLLAGTMSFAAHGVKAGTRLIANGSPEPFSNAGLSLAEDIAVLAGLVLMHFNPVVALVVFLLLLAVVIYFTPRIFRAVKTRVWLAYRKLALPASSKVEETLTTTLSAVATREFSRLNLLGETILWAVQCISKKGKRIPANHFGTLIATVEEPLKLTFVSESRWSPFGETFDVGGCNAELVPGFLADELRLSLADGKLRCAFLFDRARSKVTGEMAESIRGRLTPATPIGFTPVA